MKTFVETDGIWQELLPTDGQSTQQNESVDGEPETPTSTVTTEHGRQFVCRLKPNNIQKQLSFSGISSFARQPNGDNTITSSCRYSMKSTKIFPGRIRRRVVLKNGSVNLSKEHVDKRSQRYLRDTFTTMVDIQWRWNLLVFAMGFMLSWLGFAVIWWLICFAHGDLDHIDDKTWTPCVESINSFTSAFLFSIETQHTIGYGSRSTTEECPEAVLLMCMQSITGVMIQCFMVGFVFAKLSRPQKRSLTLMFSRNAAVCLRDGKLCLMFRIGDVRNRSHIIGASITALVISKKITDEGEVIPYFHTQLDMKFDSSESNVFMVWPATMIHQIDANSYFYNLSADELARDKFEVIVILEGTVESTGQSIQARSSYVPSEILWGHRFEQLVTYKRETGEYKVDYSKFNNTYEVDTPNCSAKDYEYERHNGSGPTGSARLTPLEMASKSSDDTSYKNSSNDSGVSNHNTVPSSAKLFPFQSSYPRSVSVR